MSPLWRVRPPHIDYRDIKFSDHADSGTRFRQIMVVVTTLAIAVTTFAESWASKGVDEAAVQAQERGVRTMQAFRWAQQQAQVNLETLALAQELRIRAATAEQRLRAAGLPRPGGGTAPPSAAESLRQERARLEAMAVAVERMTVIKRGKWASPESDTNFPLRYLTVTWRAHDREFARQDAAVERFLMWKGEANYYAACLTMFSVALYLFGLALATRTEAKVLFTKVAVALVALGAVGAAAVSVPPLWMAAVERADRGAADCPVHRAAGLPPDRLANATSGVVPDVPGAAEADRERPAVERAAACYAAALLRYRLAPDSAKYSDAIALLDRAIGARSTFAYAYLERAHAYYDSGSPQAGDYTSVADPVALRKSIEDLNRARWYLKDSTEIAANLGDAYLQLALIDPGPPGRSWWDVLLNAAFHRDARRRARWLSQSVAFTQQAIAGDPDELTLQYNLAIALLARDGLTAETRDAFTLAIARTRDFDRKRGTDPMGDPAVWSAFTDLSKVARARPDLAPGVQEMKEYILQSVAGRSPADPGVVPAHTARVDILPVGLRWTAALPAFHPGPEAKHGDVLMAAWYLVPLDRRQDPGAVLAFASGPVRPESLGGGRYTDMVRYPDVTSPPRCVPRGRYRIELYVNGRLADSGESATGPDYPGDLTPAVSPDQNTALCRPAAWPRSGKSLMGFITGYAAPDGSSGVFTYRYQHPRLPGENDDMTFRYYTERTLDDLHNVLPSRPARPEPGESCLPPALAGALDGLLRPHALPHKYAWYRYAGGCAVTRVDIFDNGTVVVDVVYGPRAFFMTREPMDILESVLSYFERS